MQTAKTDQSGWMPRLIWVFAGRTCHFVGFVVMQLKCYTGFHCHWTHLDEWVKTVLYLIQDMSLTFSSGLLRSFWICITTGSIQEQSVLGDVSRKDSLSLKVEFINLNISRSRKLEVKTEGLGLMDKLDPVKSNVVRFSGAVRIYFCVFVVLWNCDWPLTCSCGDRTKW